jgi:hypothetical protein
MNLWIRLQWFSQLDGIHQQKDSKEYSLKCLLKKFFNWFNHFLWICIILFPKNTHICTPWPQNCLFLFFNIWVSKKRRILRWFQIRGNNFKKVYLEKVICQKLLQVSSRKEYKLQFCTLLLPVTFLLANFLHFSQKFRNQHKILSFLDTHIQVLWRKSF